MYVVFASLIIVKNIIFIGTLYNGGNRMSSSRPVPVKVFRIRSNQCVCNQTYRCPFGTILYCSLLTDNKHTGLSDVLCSVSFVKTSRFSFYWAIVTDRDKEARHFIASFSICSRQRCAWKKYHTFAGVTIHCTRTYVITLSSLTLSYLYSIISSLRLSSSPAISSSHSFARIFFFSCSYSFKCFYTYI